MSTKTGTENWGDMSFIFVGHTPDVIPDVGVNPDTVMINGKEHQLLKKILEMKNANPAFLTTSSTMRSQLRTLLTATHVPLDHPLIQEIDHIQKLSGQYLPTSRESSFPSPLDSLQHISTMSAVHRAVAQNHTSEMRVFVQPAWQSPEETRQVLEAWTGKLDAIDLMIFDNDLMALIAEKFPNLTTLRLKARMDGGSDFLEHFDDSGLESIGRLLKLTTLDWEIWGSAFISSEGFAKLFAHQHLKDQLTTLTISSFRVGAEVLAEIGQYKELTSLSLHCCGPKGFETMLQSPLLQKTLLKLEIHSSEGWDSILSEQLLHELAAYQNLQELSFSSAPTTINLSLAMQRMLEGLENLERFSFSGVPFDDAMCVKMSALSNLTTLALGDCSPITKTGYPPLFHNKQKLQSLSLAKAIHLGSKAENLKAIGELEALKSLALEGLPYLEGGLQPLCTESIRANLQVLLLDNLPETSTVQFACLRQLCALKTLGLSRCPQFNDDALTTILEGLRNSLVQLQLDRVSIADGSVYAFTRLPNLKHLLLGSCWAFSASSYQSIIRSPNLQAKLQTLCLDHFPYTIDEAKGFTSFSALRGLILSNDDNLSLDDGNYLWKQAKKYTWQIMLAWGETGYAEAFKQAIADETHF